MLKQKARWGHKSKGIWRGARCIVAGGRACWGGVRGGKVSKVKSTAL